MAERVDAVVIGAGLGGLAAAVTLAGRGRQVVVLEQDTVPGGYARCFQRGRYRFDGSLHALSRLAPGGGADRLYAELGISGRLRLHRLDPLYRLLLPGREITAHADLFRYESELIGHFPSQATGIRRYLDEVLAVYHDIRRQEEDRLAGRALTAEEYRGRYPALALVRGQTWEKLLARQISDPHLRAALAGLWAYTGVPPSQCAAQVGAGLTGSLHEHGGWYPEGGSAALTSALVQALTERGGVISYSQRVDHLELVGDHAVAATTSAGRRVEAGIFITNASAPASLLDLVGREHLPAAYAARITGRAPSLPTFVIHLGLSRDVLAERGLARETFLADSCDLTAAWQAALDGDWDRATLILTDYTRIDPGCAPAGHAVVSVATAASWHYADTWGTAGDLLDYQRNPRYLQVKEQVADKLIARADAAVPGLGDAIAHREAATPLTNHRLTRNPQGAVAGYANSPANTGAGALPQQTPVSNLYLAGAWASTGGMNPVLASGAAAARLALRDHSRAPA